ncbi:MAG: hypothetical protein WCJ30_02925 [Deltaproteobacteria bacterium]
MSRRRHFVALLVACAACWTVAPRQACADDPVSIEGLSPEMLGALGGTVPPEILAALVAAAGGPRAGQSGTAPAGVDPRVLSSALSTMDPTAGAGASGGRVVDLQPDDAVEPHRRPERIVPGRGRGIVEVRHEHDGAPSDATSPHEPPVATPTTVLPTIRVSAPRRGRPRSQRTTPAPRQHPAR